MSKVYLDQEIAELADNINWSAFKFTDWFDARSTMTHVIFMGKRTKRIVKETDVLPKEFEGYRVGYSNNFSYLFDPDGNYTGVKIGYHIAASCQNDWRESNAFVAPSKAATFDPVKLKLHQISWELTPCKRPSNDCLKQCRFSMLKDEMENCERNGWSFDPDDYF